LAIILHAHVDDIAWITKNATHSSSNTRTNQHLNKAWLYRKGKKRGKII
jgi:hypothetical protein